MLKANIEKVDNVAENMRRTYETLTRGEISKLRKRTIGHGNMKAAEEATGLTRNTIMKAREGGKITNMTASIIREYLNPIQ